MKTLLTTLLAGLISTTAHGARNITLGSIPFSMMVRPGPSIDTSGYLPGGDWYNNSDGVTADSQFFGRNFHLVLSNLSAITQTTRVELFVNGVSWVAPTHSYVEIQLGGQGATKTDRKQSPNDMNVESDSFTIPPNSASKLIASIMFYGPTTFANSLFRAVATLTFRVKINEDRGAVMGSVASNPMVSISGKKGSLTSLDTLEDAFIGASLAHFSVQLSGGRPF